MADRTSIEWTDATWNPIVGCSVVSPGCTNCYAMRLAGTRLKHHPCRAGLTTDTKAGPVWTGETRFDEKALLQPLRWRRPRKIFVCAHSDLFHEAALDEWIDRVFAVMALCPQHTFQVLTKRPERMREYLSSEKTLRRVYWTACDIAVDERVDVVLIADPAHERFAPSGMRVYLDHWPLLNIWLGVTAEDQTRADKRVPVLLATPAVTRFVSIEPMLGAVDLRAIAWGHSNALNRLDWVICGGESGPNARPMHPDWVRSLRDQCAAAAVPFFFKQWGEWAPGEAADGPQTRTERGAWWFNGRWSQRDITVRDGEEMHVDYEPDVWRVGRRAAGRWLDGALHNAFPKD